MKFKVIDYVDENGKTVTWCVRLTNALCGIPQEAGDVLRWCREQFGMNAEETNSSDHRWYVTRDGHSAYYFRDPTDCKWFLLRWS